MDGLVMIAPDVVVVSIEKNGCVDNIIDDDVWLL